MEISNNFYTDIMADSNKELQKTNTIVGKYNKGFSPNLILKKK